jgi:YHS domain-containing protein
MKKLTVLLATLVFGVAGLTHAEDAASIDPVTTCIVSGEALDSMGKPFVFTYDGQEVKLCCKSCKKDFDKNPEEYLAKLKAAQATHGESSEAVDQ